MNGIIIFCVSLVLLILVVSIVFLVLDLQNVRKLRDSCNQNLNNFSCKNGMFMHNDSPSLIKMGKCIDDKCKSQCKTSTGSPTKDCMDCLVKNDCGVSCTSNSNMQN